MLNNGKKKWRIIMIRNKVDQVVKVERKRVREKKMKQYAMGRLWIYDVTKRYGTKSWSWYKN